MATTRRPCARCSIQDRWQLRNRIIASTKPPPGGVGPLQCTAISGRRNGVYAGLSSPTECHYGKRIADAACQRDRLFHSGRHEQDCEQNKI